ncbi:hypothetical protein GMJLKIPL_1974 [Methylobacterium isbiliense]|uniref:Uncharacterized protein n=1 Tax=Methylobacterium isbiliense TaxID=315478 RepID=A0ABQ4SA34_9HYPH|nr:hypothetical protein GMJLKIPL_1974 [Methylobacterium isbiliense]
MPDAVRRPRTAGAVVTIRRPARAVGRPCRSGCRYFRRALRAA